MNANGCGDGATRKVKLITWEQGKVKIVKYFGTTFQTNPNLNPLNIYSFHILRQCGGRLESVVCYKVYCKQSENYEKPHKLLRRNKRENSEFRRWVLCLFSWVACCKDYTKTQVKEHAWIKSRVFNFNHKAGSLNLSEGRRNKTFRILKWIYWINFNETW